MTGAIVWQRPQLLWLTILLFALSATSWLLFDRFTTRVLGARLRAALFFFRMLALTLIAVSLLRPAIRVREPSAHRGTVAILVDESASMGVVDSARSRADLVPLAAALGDIDGKLRDPNLSKLSGTVAALEPAAEELSRVAGELEYARLTQRSIEPAAARVHEAQAQLDARLTQAEQVASRISEASTIATSLRSINASAATTRPEGLNELIRASMGSSRLLQNQSDAKLDETNPIVRRAVDGLLDRPRLDLTQRCLRVALPQLSSQFSYRIFGFGRTLLNETGVDGLDSSQAATDLFTAVRELRHRLAGERLSAILICSDGRQTEPLAGDPVNTADLPIYAINPSTATLFDLAVQQIVLPRAVFAGEPATAFVSLSQTPAAARSINVSLTAEGKNRVRRVELNGPTTRAAITFTANSVGPLPIDALVEAQPSEASLLNNSLRSWTRVTRVPLRVMLLRSNDTPNVSSLRAALRNDLSITLTMPPLDAERDLSDTLMEQDLVILSDVPYVRLSDETWLGLRRFVRERGGAVLIASASPSIYLDYAQHPYTAPLLAWSADQSPTLRLWPGASPTFRPVPANGEAVGSLPLADDPEINRQIWRDLPALFHVLNFPSLSATAQPLMVEAQTRSPLLAMQWLGFGRIALLGSDEIYRWNTPLLSSQIFWRRLIDVVTGGAYAVDDGVLALDADTLSPQPDQTVRLRTKVRAGARYESEEAFDPPLLVVERNGRRYFSQLLTPPTDPFASRTEVTLQKLQAGMYRISLLWADREVMLPLLVADSFSRELNNVAGDPGTLATLAGPRGAVLPLEELPGIAKRVEAASDPSPAVVTYGLWDSPYLFLLIVGCFGVDWAIRQFAGLA